MLPSTTLTPKPVATRDLPAFAHAEAYVHYFERLAQAPAPRASLRRLLTHLDADLEGGERVGLWYALWRCAQRLTPAEREVIGQCLDGRHAARLARLAEAWEAPSLIEQLAEEALQFKGQAEFVPALLAHHRLQPLSQPDAYAPRLVMLAVRAELASATQRLDAVAIDRLVAAASNAAAREPELGAPALAALFDLALHARDEDTAVATLAELLKADQGRELTRDRVRAWLDGTAMMDRDDDFALPLTLAPRWQQQWLQPVAWNRHAMLAAVAGALQRPAVRARMHRLIEAMGFAVPARPYQPRAASLRALTALDGAYAMFEDGGDAMDAVRPILEPGSLAAPALAAVHRIHARRLALAGDVEGQALALARARQALPGAAVRRDLAALLPQLGTLAQAAPEALGADWRREEPFWKAALRDGDGALQRVAGYHLARLWTDGALEPGAPTKCQHLEAARALWQWLAPFPAYADDARSALTSPTLQLMLQMLRRDGGVEHLWIDHPGATRLTIVFSCVLSHHTFPEVQRLRSQLPGQHLLFLRNPEKDWYSGASFDALCSLVRERVLTRFAPAEVTCYYGSMGGHGALKMALEFGFRAIVFNPQTDLDLWAAFRPRERALLWGAERHARLAEWPLAAWGQAPLYLACGAATADREALSVVLERLRRCRHASVILEKFADDNHAGLMNRIAGGPVAPVLAAITQRLKQLSVAPTPGAAPLPDPPAQAAFWDRLDAARSIKVEVQVRDGTLWWQRSTATGTRP